MAALPKVKLSDLPPAEKERTLAFLVANQVDFKPDLSGNFTATVKVLRPQAPKMSPSAKPASRPEKVMAGWEKSASSTPSTAAPEDQKTPGSTAPLAAAVELRKRYKTFTGLLPNLSQHPKTMLKAELVGFIEEVYTARYNQDLMQVQQHAEAEALGAKKKKKLPTDLTSFPQSVLTVAGKRYGLRQMVGQVCWSVAKSVEQFRSEHQGIETFARFLEESYDAVDVLFYLEMRWAARQMTMPRGNWTSWRKTPQVFTPQPRFLGNSHDTNNAASKTACPSSRPQLTLKQAVSAVREGIDPEAPEALKAAIASRLKAEGAGGQIDWDQFLAICTQEYRKARCITVSEPLEKSSSKFRSVVQFARLIRQTWEISVPDAFEKFDQEGSGVLSSESFKEVAVNELGLKASKAEDIWSLLDAEKKGHVEREEWELLDVSDEADHPEEEPIFPPGWDAELSPEESGEILQEAQQVAVRLAASLEEHGEVVNENEVLGWALRSVLQRKGLKSRPSSTPGLRANQAPHSYASLEQMGEAYRLGASGQKQSTGLEDTVREHLASATKKLVDEALHEAGPANVPELKAVKEELLQEFLVVTDALMEALVTGDLGAWQTQLNISDSTGAQQRNFQELTEEFQQLLSADEASNQGLVAHVCTATASTVEVQDMCHQRALQLLEDRGIAVVPPTPYFPQVDDPQQSQEDNQDGADGGLEIEDAF